MKFLEYIENAEQTADMHGRVGEWYKLEICDGIKDIFPPPTCFSVWPLPLSNWQVMTVQMVFNKKAKKTVIINTTNFITIPCTRFRHTFPTNEITRVYTGVVVERSFEWNLYLMERAEFRSVGRKASFVNRLDSIKRTR